MNAHNGSAITDLDHIRQSVADILTTRIGSRVMRRDYGSLLPDLIDQPLNEATLLRAYSAAITALLIWEPRIRVQRIAQRMESAHTGAATLALDAITADAQPVNVDVPLSRQLRHG